MMVSKNLQRINSKIVTNERNKKMRSKKDVSTEERQEIIDELKL